jgi:hypothetical protein
VLGVSVAALAVAARADAAPPGAAVSQPASQPASQRVRAPAPRRALTLRTAPRRRAPAPGHERTYLTIAVILAPTTWWGLENVEGTSTRGVSAGFGGGMHFAHYTRLRPGWHMGAYFSWVILEDVTCQCGVGVTARVHLGDYRYGRVAAALDLGLQLQGAPRHLSLGPQLYPRVQVDFRRGPGSDYRWAPFLSFGPLVAPVLARLDDSDRLYWSLGLLVQAGLAFSR